MKELSDTRAANWPNTLQAQRARKERAKVERQAAEEAERVEIDTQEAELRAEQRRIQIERANKILFDETDRVKSFHSKMLLSDVMKENEQLVEVKRQIDVLRKAQEAAFVEQQRQALEAAEVAELRKMEETRRKALSQRDIQMQQLEQLKTKILAERAEDRQEGELLKLKALEEAEEMRRKEEARLAKSRQLNSDTKAANAVLQTFRLKEVERQKEQELAIEAYGRKKAEMTAERTRREAEKRALKDAERKRIADAMEANYVTWHTKEEARLARDVAEAEAAASANEAARRKKAAETQASIDASRQAQLRAKAEAKVRTRAEELEFAATWGQRTRELKEEEDRERMEKLAAGRQLQAFQMRQAGIKARRLADARIAELQEAAQLVLSLNEQEDIFMRYADECIDEYRRQGKSVVPMQLHLAKKTTVETMR